LAAKQQVELDLCDERAEKKRLRADLDKTLSKEKLAELIKD